MCYVVRDLPLAAAHDGSFARDSMKATLASYLRKCGVVDSEVEIVGSKHHMAAASYETAPMPTDCVCEMHEQRLIAKNNLQVFS